MENLVRGIHHFQTTQFNAHWELFKHLSEVQRPDTLMIICSGSRITPNLLLQTKPGDIFVLGNAGDIIPHKLHIGLMAYTAVMVVVTDFLTGVLSAIMSCAVLYRFFNTPAVEQLDQQEFAIGD